VAFEQQILCYRGNKERKKVQIKNSDMKRDNYYSKNKGKGKSKAVPVLN
jgi:hypothetical protein